jgi:hypothetical protein
MVDGYGLTTRNSRLYRNSQALQPAMSLLQAILPNGLIAVALGLYVLLDRRLGALLVATFAYCTLHFSSAAWTLLTTPDAREALRLVPGEPVSQVARAWGLAFVVFLLVELAWRYRGEWASWFRRRDRLGLVLAASGVGAALLVGLGLNVLIAESAPPLAFKDVAAMLMMLALALFLTAAFTAEGPEAREEALRMLLRVAAVLAVLAALVALFELNTGRTRAYTDLPGGIRVERASSLLFDPNLFGMWCAAVALFAGRFLYRQGGRWWSVAALVSAGAGLLFSGSRSALILYLAMVAVLLVHRLRHHGPQRLPDVLSPAALTLGSLLSVGGLALLLGWILPSEPRVLSNAALILVERLLSLPLDMGGYLFARLGLLAPAEPKGNYDPTEISVEGRFEGAVPDNGYLAALDAAGPLGFAAVLALLLGLAFLAYRRVWPRPEADAGYVLAAGTGCALSGMFLRAFTVFPLWVFVALGMAVVLAAVLPRRKGEPSAGSRHGDGPPHAASPSRGRPAP